MIISGTRIRGGTIKGANVVDPYFNLVTLLLPGNGANGAANQTFVDGSTNNFTITATGTVTQGTITPFSPGGYSYWFDVSSNNHLKLPANTAFSFTGNFTIEAWVWLTDITSGPYTIFGCTTAVNQFFDFRIYQSNIQVSLNASSGTNLGLGTLSTDRWAHMALVRSGSSIKCYVDGIQTATTLSNSSTLCSGTQETFVGVTTSSGSNQFRGWISNLRVLKGTALYTANFTPPTAPLTAIANTSLLTCQSNRFIDNSTNAFSITTAGNPYVRSFSPFLPTSQYTTAANGGSAAIGVIDTAYFTTPASNETAFAFGTGDFTWECWINPFSGGSSDRTIFEFATTGGTSQGTLYFTQNPNSTTSVSTLKYGQGETVLYSQNYSQTFFYQWSHVAVSRVSGTTRIFVNGTQLGSSFSDTTNYAASRFFMGVNKNLVSNVYTGYITSVKIVKGTGLYTANFTCPTAPPTATNAQLLLNMTNAGIVDATCDFNLQTVGNTSLSNALGVSAIYFDGTGDWLRGYLPLLNPETKFDQTNFTIELWMFMASADAGPTRDLVVSEGSWRVRLDGTLVRWLSSNATIETSTSIPTNAWVHIAVVRSGLGANQFKIYINGVAGATSGDGTNFASGNYYIGAAHDGNLFKGYIQNLRITRGYARYTANFTPPTQPFPTQ